MLSIVGFLRIAYIPKMCCDGLKRRPIKLIVPKIVYFSLDPWIKVNTALVCFGARDDQFGKFFVPSSGKLASVKLVHVYGYVTCDKNIAYHWCYWGCGKHSRLTNHVDAAITTSEGQVLLPSSHYITDVTRKWSLIPGYNSLSPELVLSTFSNPPKVTGGQELRLWYGEDLANSSEADNGGKSCCDIYTRFIWISVIKSYSFAAFL